MQSAPRIVLALIIGLLMGSVLPAELLARRRGVDLQSVGDGNPGAWNAFRGLGRGPGIVTLAYDASVGILAIGIAGLLGVSDGFAYLAGTMSIVGHRFPVFKGLRGGGQGMAATAGLTVWGAAEALLRGWLSPADLGLLAAILVATYAVTRSSKMMALVMLPALAMEVLISPADPRFTAFMTAWVSYIWVMQLAAQRRERLTHAAAPIHQCRPQ